MTNLSQLIAKAAEGVVVDGHLILSANMPVKGGTLYCSHRYRGANSRGARRGKGLTVRFCFKADGEQYSKDISKAKAIELIGKE